MTDRVMDCGDLGPFLLGELSEEESAAFLGHVADCPSCSKELPALWPAHEGLLFFSARPGLSATFGGGREEGLFPELPFEFRTDLKARVLAAAFEARPPEAVAPDAAPDVSLDAVRPPKGGDSHFKPNRLSLTRAPGHPPNRSPRVVQFRRWVPAAASSLVSLLVGMLIGVRLSAPSAPAAIRPSPTQLVAEARLVSTRASSPGARGVVMVVRRAGQANLIVTVQNLAPAKGPAWYHVWLLKSGVRHSAGVFTVNPKGQGALSVVLPKSLSFDAVGITREPTAFDSSPRGPKVLGAKIRNM